MERELAKHPPEIREESLAKYPAKARFGRLKAGETPAAADPEVRA